MDELGPFEGRARLAVAVSGGPDSMALCLLADSWARRRDGHVVAVTVDHGLRAGSAIEAATVGRWMAARGIEHRVLTWDGIKPRSAIQARARAARYDLLTDWCRRADILHLGLAHELEDQAETVVMRLTKGSGARGLAGMSAINEMTGVRILRPLLAVERGRLTATLQALGQAWVEDPSNRDTAFERVRARQLLPALGQAGCGPGYLAGLAAAFADRRLESERAAAGLLARSCRLSPVGYAVLDPSALAAAPPETALNALSRVLCTVGVASYPVRRSKLDALWSWISGGAGPSSVTLAGCRCLRHSNGIVICREGRHLPAPVAMTPGERILWDGRFDIEMVEDGADGGAASTGTPMLVALGRDGWAEVAEAAPDRRRTPIPYPARLTLPAVRDSAGIVEVPFIGYRRGREEGMASLFKRMVFSPRNSLSGVGFCLAPRVSHTI